MKFEVLDVGTVVQLNPDTVRNKMFKACFMIVTETKGFGAQGYVEVPGGGQAYYRATWEEMEVIGKAEWVVQ